MQMFTLLVLPYIPSLPAATAAPLLHFFYIYPGFPRVVEELMAVAFKVHEVLKKTKSGPILTIVRIMYSSFRGCSFIIVLALKENTMIW